MPENTLPPANSPTGIDLPVGHTVVPASNKPAPVVAPKPVVATAIPPANVATARPVVPVAPVVPVKPEQKNTGDAKQAPPSWDIPEAHLVLVEKNLMQYAGKKGFNPHYYLQDKVVPVKNRFASGERSPELYSAIMKLDKTYVPKAPTAAEIAQRR